jgi:hypothetical protein
MIVGYFEAIVLVMLVLVNIFFWKKSIKQNVGCLITGLLFGLILPMISQKIEIERVTSEREIWDNYELLYTFLRFPIYWIVGAIQSAVFTNKNSVLKQDSQP